MQKSQLYSIAFGFSLLVLLSFSLLLNNSINSLKDRSYWAQHSQIIIDKLQKLNLSMLDIEASQRGFLLTGDTTLLDLLISSRNKIPLFLDTLHQLTKDNQEQTHNVLLLRDAVARRLQKIQEVLNRKQFLGSDVVSIELQEGNVLMNEFRKRIKIISDQEQTLLITRMQSKQAYEQVTPNYFKAVFSITTIIALISFVLLLKELRQRLKTQSLLETRVHALARTNTELQQISHVTSHDLQEPLRKIRTFSDILLSNFATLLPEDARTMLQRIDKNANNIRELVADLSDFTNLANNNEEKVNVDINKILLNVQKELAGLLKEKKTEFSISPLPVIEGFEKQLHTLFKEVITNAVKFSKENVINEITITGNLVLSHQMRKDMQLGNRNFNVISVYDHGIGFDNEYAHKIFILFQKLHGNNSDYKGKGIGLAVCQRIMTNHDGFITATGEVDKGATFQFYFPINTGG